ncbi:MAG: DUF3995 domain-containing protein [Crocinitomicaceae bacterium]
MLTVVLSLVLFLVFIILGGFHFYWLFGGVYGLKKVFPTKSNDEISIRIPKVATLIVALGLTSVGVLYLILSGLVNLDLPAWVIQTGSWIVPIVFTVRAIGEFNYVGFFKKIKNTEFAKADTILYSPLCLGIGVFGFLILYLGW